MGSIDDADTALDGCLHVDTVGEAIALELADEFGARRDVQDRAIHIRRAMTYDQGVESGRQFGPQSRRIGRIVRRSTPDSGPRRGPFGGQPFPVRETLQPSEPLAGDIFAPHGRIATHQDPRPAVHEALLSAGMTRSENSCMPASDGKSTNHSIKWEMPSPL